ncbi:fumarylacetoacetate hydrolase family protein [Pseudomonadota bacterium]
MAHWMRYEHQGKIGFGTLQDETISVHSGNMYTNPSPTGEEVALGEVKVLTPTVPTKMLCLWNNYHALAQKMEQPIPPHPLYLLKGNNAFLAANETIRRPSSYGGPVVYEGELGVVIGKSCSEVSEADADDFIFGYTCINDVTAGQIISEDPTFAQWVRAKSFDTFGVFGPVVATDVNPNDLNVKTTLNGEVRQDYSTSDLIFTPQQQVSLISHNMTLEPGDVICVGTSVGVGAMKEPSNTIDITIGGIGTLSNTYVN